MTCIVGLEHDGNVYLACDSAQSDGHFISGIDCAKLFTNRGVTFGYTSSFRFADILQYDLKVPKRTRAHKKLDDKQFLVSVVVKSIRKALEKGGYTLISNNREKGGVALLAYNGKLYRLQEDFSLVRTEDGYASCGSGDTFALGSLSSTWRFPPEERVRLAVEAAAKFCTTVQGPVHQIKV